MDVGVYNYFRVCIEFGWYGISYNLLTENDYCLFDALEDSLRSHNFNLFYKLIM